MIRLKQILLEISDSDFSRIQEKIRNKEFRFIGQGDNGRVYEIDGEDKVFIGADRIAANVHPAALSGRDILQ